MDSDTVFTYIFTLIFLNTNLHQPRVDKKMSLEDFEKNVEMVVGKENKPSQEDIEHM